MSYQSDKELVINHAFKSLNPGTMMCETMRPSVGNCKRKEVLVFPDHKVRSMTAVMSMCSELGWAIEDVEMGTAVQFTNRDKSWPSAWTVVRLQEDGVTLIKAPIGTGFRD